MSSPWARVQDTLCTGGNQKLLCTRCKFSLCSELTYGSIADKATDGENPQQLLQWCGRAQYQGKQVILWFLDFMGFPRWPWHIPGIRHLHLRFLGWGCCLTSDRKPWIGTILGAVRSNMPNPSFMLSCQTRFQWTLLNPDSNPAHVMPTNQSKKQQRSTHKWKNSRESGEWGVDQCEEQTERHTKKATSV